MSELSLYDIGNDVFSYLLSYLNRSDIISLFAVSISFSRLYSKEFGNYLIFKKIPFWFPIEHVKHGSFKCYDELTPWSLTPNEKKRKIESLTIQKYMKEKVKSIDLTLFSLTEYAGEVPVYYPDSIKEHRIFGLSSFCQRFPRYLEKLYIGRIFARGLFADSFLPNTLVELHFGMSDMDINEKDIILNFEYLNNLKSIIIDHMHCSQILLPESVERVIISGICIFTKEFGNNLKEMRLTGLFKGFRPLPESLEIFVFKDNMFNELGFSTIMMPSKCKVFHHCSPDRHNERCIGKD